MTTATGHDLYVDGFPHGTPAGYQQGCHGRACPNLIEHGQSCADANMRYNRDWTYRKLVDNGAPLDQLQLRETLNNTPSKPTPKPTTPKPATPAAPKPTVPADTTSTPAARLEPAFTHGTQSGYVRHNCRCNLCKAWKSAKNRLDRERRLALASTIAPAATPTQTPPRVGPHKIELPGINAPTLPGINAPTTEQPTPTATEALAEVPAPVEAPAPVHEQTIVVQGLIEAVRVVSEASVDAQHVVARIHLLADALERAAHLFREAVGETR